MTLWNGCDIIGIDIMRVDIMGMDLIGIDIGVVDQTHNEHTYTFKLF